MASNDETINDEAAIPPSPVSDLVSGFSNLSLSNEWFKDHSLADAPLPWEPGIEDITASTKYPLGENWTSNKKVNLKKIVKNLPAFLKQMQDDIKENLKHPIQQIPNKGGKSAGYQARGLPDRQYQKADQKEYSVDVHGYMLNISIPTTNETFLIDESNKVCKPDLVSNGDKRWIFIPSYLRASCALFDWSRAGIVKENTIRIVVVRPDQYDNYIKYCGYLLPIISLPKNEEGVGYARYWIQKIATEFGLPYIWMIDDSVKQFYEVHPDDKKQQRTFEKVFKEMERYVKEAKEKEYPLAAISPARFNRFPPGKNAFTYKPPQGAVYLNISAINKKGIKYRPQSKVFEDMLFGAECVYTGKLWVVRWNRVQLFDVPWKNSGADVFSSRKKTEEEDDDEEGEEDEEEEQ